jgi:hypothetical protein
VCVVFAIKVWQMQIDKRDKACISWHEYSRGNPNKGGKAITNELLTMMDTPLKPLLTHLHSPNGWEVGGWVVIRCQMRAGRTRA